MRSMSEIQNTEVNAGWFDLKHFPSLHWNIAVIGNVSMAFCSQGGLLRVKLPMDTSSNGHQFPRTSLWPQWTDLLQRKVERIWTVMFIYSSRFIAELFIRPDVDLKSSRCWSGKLELGITSFLTFTVSSILLFNARYYGIRRDDNGRHARSLPE